MKNILVTGGTRGIGEAIVRKLSVSNQVIFTYLNSIDKALEIEKQTKSKSYKVDGKNPKEVEECIKTIIKTYSKIDVLINNLGIIDDSLFVVMSNDRWDNVIKTNLYSTFYFSKYVSKEMIKQRQGNIINISSIVASIGNKGQINYIASKSAIEGITRAMAIELSSKNIRVNAVAPGFIETDMTNNISQENKDKIKNRILLKRFGKPEEVANLVNFLISDESSYINGQVINIDGGIFLNF
ncbi:MAG: beta-ketoacyl-ACP reductase [Candidatus Sericytochromatia bacterium]|nr:MAG: beta-ketoacyl-ACP reductase [Candidatus Sericytochromatia bacterium]